MGFVFKCTGTDCDLGLTFDRGTALQHWCLDMKTRYFDILEANKTIKTKEYNCMENYEKIQIMTQVTMTKGK